MDALADADCVLTVQALAAFFHAARRNGKMPTKEAAALRDEHGFGLWDAILVEATRAAGVTRFLTEDLQDGRGVGALLLENPFKAGFDLGLD
jgi:predicted nucleic acid-binding protein